MGVLFTIVSLLVGNGEAFSSPLLATRAIGRNTSSKSTTKPLKKPVAKSVITPSKEKTAVAANKPVPKATISKTITKQVNKSTAPNGLFAKANGIKNPFAKPASAKSISMAKPKKSPVKKLSERKLGDYPDLPFGLYNGEKKIGFYPTLDPKLFVDPKKVVRNPYRNNAPVS